MKNSLALSALCLALTSCASIISGSTQSIELKANTGTDFLVKNNNGAQIMSGTTPAVIELKRGNGYFKTASYSVDFKKPGYKTKRVDIVPGFNGWYIGNLIFGGAILGMLIVDPITGAMYTLNPNSIDATLEPSGEPLDSAGNMARPPALTGDTRSVSIHDYEAQQLAKAQRCTVFGNGAVERLQAGIDRITYRCTDNRALQMDCANAKGCQLTQ